MEISNKVGAAEITSRVVEDLKDENEQYRKMVMDCIEKVTAIRTSVLLHFIGVECVEMCPPNVHLGWPCHFRNRTSAVMFGESQQD